MHSTTTLHDARRGRQTPEGTASEKSGSAVHCDHQRQGAVRFDAGHWECADCGRRLQVAEAASGWEAFGQISRYAACCAVLSACVPFLLCLLPKTDHGDGRLLASQPMAESRVFRAPADADDGSRLVRVSVAGFAAPTLPRFDESRDGLQLAVDNR